MTDAPRFRRLVLATDLGADAPAVFAQALGVALRLRADLYVVHVSDADHPDATWRSLPAVRSVLESWGKLPPDAPHADFEALGVRVHPVERSPTDDLVSAVIRRVLELEPDVLLLGTHPRGALAQLVQPSVAEAVARSALRTTLFLPAPVRPLVSPATGDVGLRRILVPLSGDVPAGPLLDELAALTAALTDGPVEFVLLHAGTQESVPDLRLPTRSGWSYRTDVAPGRPVARILEAEVTHSVDLVAMATHGHEGLLDDLLGSTTEQVVRGTRVPVLAVPV